MVERSLVEEYNLQNIDLAEEEDAVAVVSLHTFRHVTKDDSLGPTTEEIREVIFAVVVVKEGDRPSALRTICVFAQEAIGADEYQTMAATVQIFKLIERSPDTNPGDLEGSVNRFLQGNKELVCKWFFSPTLRP